MDLNSPNKRLRLKFDFKDHLHTKSKVSSPTVGLRTVGSSLGRFSETSSPKFNSFKPSEAKIIEEILFQSRRLDPNFSINVDSSNYDLAVVYTLRKAIDLILDSQNKDLTLEIQKFQEKIADLNEKLEKSRYEYQNYVEIEKKLILKEEQIAIDLIKINSEKKKLENEKNQIAPIKKKCFMLENEVRLLKSNLESEKNENIEKDLKINDLLTELTEKKFVIENLNAKKATEVKELRELRQEIREESDKIDAKMEKIKKEFEKLEEEQFDINNQKQNLAEEVYQLNELKKKIEEDLEFLKNNNKELSKFRIDIEIEQKKLKDLRKNLEINKLELEASQRELSKQKNEFQQELSGFLEQKREFEIKEQNFSDKINRKLKDEHPKLSWSIEVNEKVQISRLEDISTIEKKSEIINSEDLWSNKQNRSDPISYFPELKKLINDYKTELVQSRDYMEQWSLSLYDREVTFQKRLNDIDILCVALERNFDENPSIQGIFFTFKNLLVEVHGKKLDLEKEFERINKESLDTNYHFNTKTSEVVLDLMKKFENKAIELQNLETHLLELQETLESQAQQNSRIAEYLKQERIIFEKEKIEIKLEIDNANANLIQIQEKFNTKIEKINKREQELAAMQNLCDSITPYSDDLSVSLN